MQAGDSRGAHKVIKKFPFVKNQFYITVKSRLSSAKRETSEICWISNYSNNVTTIPENYYISSKW